MNRYVTLFMISVLCTSVVVGIGTSYGQPTLSVSPTSGPAGSVVTVTGEGFLVNQQPMQGMSIFFNKNQLLTTVNADSEGSFTVDVTIPSHAEIGPHTIDAEIGAGEFATAEFTVTELEASITLSPTSGLEGAEVTITGMAFGASEPITIEFNGESIDTDPFPITTSPEGTFEALITIPSVAAGNYTISAISDTASADATFTVVETSITISPTSGIAGTVVTISGMHFSPEQTIIITFAGETIETDPPTITSDETGNFTATITIPIDIEAGSYEVEVSDEVHTRSTTFTVVETSITLFPTMGPVDTTVEIEGVGFAIEDIITITFDNSTLITDPTVVTTDSIGAFTASILIPDAEIGLHTIAATDGDGRTATAEFTVTELQPTITLSPSSGAEGTEVTITGIGFGTELTITIEFDNESIATDPSLITTDADGRFTASITVPLTAGMGEHTVIAIDAEGRIGTAIFTVEEEVQVGLIFISPLIGPPESSVTVSGADFPPDTEVSITINGESVAIDPPLVTASDGTFSTTITIPDLPSGSYTISVTVGTQTASDTFTVIIAQPADVVDIAEVNIVDAGGNEVSEIFVGMDILIESEVENTHTENQPFVYIVQVKDSDGVTVMISWIVGTLPPGERFSVAQSWSVESSGEYTAEIFVWESMETPVALSPMLQTSLSVQ